MIICDKNRVLEQQCVMPHRMKKSLLQDLGGYWSKYSPTVGITTFQCAGSSLGIMGLDIHVLLSPVLSHLLSHNNRTNCTSEQLDFVLSCRENKPPTRFHVHHSTFSPLITLAEKKKESLYTFSTPPHVSWP